MTKFCFRLEDWMESSEDMQENGKERLKIERLGHLEEGEKGDLTFSYDRDFQPGDIVEHFKGNLYKIVAFGTNTETEEKMVVYQSLKDQKIWIRGYDMFTSQVDRSKSLQPYRFIKVKINL